MSGFVSGFQKFFTKDRVMILVIFILLSVFLLYYSTGKMTVMDGMDSAESSVPERKEGEATLPQVSALAPVSSMAYSNQSVASPSELLPSDANSQWASLNPVNQSNPQLPDMLQAGYHIGLDTIGQTMKNANLQLRSDPVIEKAVIGPWNQSTIEPDLMRVPLEVGCKT
jgi:hypothetical protein